MIDEALKQVLLGGGLSGVLAALLVLSLLVNRSLFNYNTKCNSDLVAQRKEFEDSLKEIYNEQLLPLTDKVVVALERNTAVLADLSRAVEGRATVIDANAKAITQLLSIRDSDSLLWKPQLQAIFDAVKQVKDVVIPPPQPPWGTKQ